MDPVVASIVAAIAGAAATSLAKVTSDAIEESYSALKHLIEKRFEIDLSPIERRPESENSKGSLAEQLEDKSAGKDRDVVSEAERLLALLRAEADKGTLPETAIRNIRGQNVRISKIASEADRLVIDGVVGDRDVQITDLVHRRRAPSKKNEKRTR